MAMKKLVLLRWLQGSWKSTWAQNEAKEKYAVVYNKDTLRRELHNGVFSKSNEKIVVALERNMVKVQMEVEYPYIIVDNTHLGEENPHIEFYKKLAEDNWYEVEIKEFTTPLWECIERDSKREGSARVGAKVILDTYNRSKKVEKNYPKRVQDKSLPEAYIFDIDWTLAHMSGRSPYDYSQVHTDIVDEDVKRMRDNLVSNGYDIIIVSWRNENCRFETAKWLKDNWIYFQALYMRGEDDTRNDAIVKKEIAEQYILPMYNVRGVFDDRLRVCRMWHEIGLTLFRVWNPDADF